MKKKLMGYTIKNIEIENFKCFKKKVIIDFEKITILTGANSSGKSSILHAVLGLIQSGEFPYKFSTNGKFVNMGDFIQISNEHNENNKIRINIKFSTTNTTPVYQYQINTEWVQDSSTYLPKLNYLKILTDGTIFELKSKRSYYSLNFFYDPKLDPEYTPEKAVKIRKDFQERVINQFSKEKFTSKSEYNKEIRRLKILSSSIFKKWEVVNYKIDNIENIIEETEVLANMNLEYVLNGLIRGLSTGYLNSINAISSFRHHPDRTYLEQSKDRLKIDKFGEGYLDQILLWERKNQKKFGELNSIMKELGLFDRISSNRIKGGRYEAQILTNKSKVMNSIFDVGFGISQFLPIIVADLQLNNYSTLFVAEPEIHLHPSVQAKFADYLVDKIEKNKKTYIIETHSEYLLNRLRLHIVKGTLKESDLSIYFLENMGEDVILHKLNFNKKGQIENAPQSFFDTYYMDIKDIALNSF